MRHKFIKVSYLSFLIISLPILAVKGDDIKNKDLAIEYAKRNNIDYELIEPKSRNIVKKSYSDNFTE